MNDPPYHRYILEDLPTVSFSDYDLIKSQQRKTHYKIKNVLDMKRENNKVYYKCWIQGKLKRDAKWIPKTDLKSGKEKLLIQEFEDANN